MNYIIKNINFLSLHFVKFSLYLISFLVAFSLNMIINLGLIAFGFAHCMFYMFFYLLNKYYSLEAKAFDRKRTQLRSLGYNFRNHLRLAVDILEDIFCLILFGLFRYEMKLTKLLFNVFFLTLVNFYDIVIDHVLLRFYNAIRFNMKYLASFLFNEDIEILVPSFKIMELLDHIRAKNQAYVNDAVIDQINSSIASLKHNMIEFFMPIPKFFSACVCRAIIAINDRIRTTNPIFKNWYRVFGLVMYLVLLTFSTALFNPDFHLELNQAIGVSNYEPSGMTSLVLAFFVVAISLLCLVLSIYINLSYSIYELFSYIFLGPCDRLCQMWSLYNLPSEALDHSMSSKTEEMFIKNESPVVHELCLDSLSLERSHEDELSA